MKISETHKNFEGGFKGRVTIKTDDGIVVDAIFTRVQKAKDFCEKNPDTSEGRRYAAAVLKASGETSVFAPTPVPAPPALSGANPANTALLSAQRKLAKLYATACKGELAVLWKIKTSRGNKYLNTCDDYRKALLVHFKVL